MGKEQSVAEGKLGRYFTEEQGAYRCLLCPRACLLKPGKRGFCYVRQASPEGIHLTTYGRSSGFCIDPIEKKPLNHFYPGTPVLTFGTAGCNLACRFCQNWDISKARTWDTLSSQATPEGVVEAALHHGCKSIAFSYNDPVIFAEYAIDIAKICRAKGVKTVAVTAGYITDLAREEFFSAMDAVNIDLKAFTEDFYHKLSLAHLQPVLDTLKYLIHKTDTWVEITTLLIPGHNDSKKEIQQLCEWVAEELNVAVPMHFTAFHPDFKMLEVPPTPHETLLQARKIALDVGLQYVYVGNVHDSVASSTYCPHCDHLLIERDWYVLGKKGLTGNRCDQCGNEIPGHFESEFGTWGAKRKPIVME